MKMKAFIILFCVIVLVACHDNIPTTPEPPDPPKEYPKGLKDAKAFDNLQHIVSLERLQRQDTVLIIIAGDGVHLNGIITGGNVWSYHFAVLKNNVETDYVWYVWQDGKVELPHVGPPIKSNWVKELAPLLKINSDEAIMLARKYGAKDYIKIHPHAQVKMEYIWKGNLAVITMWFSDPEQIGECEPEWWIRADTGDLLYTDYNQYCHE